MRLAAILPALLVSASAFAQTPQDPTAPDTRVLDARIRALERAAASSGSGSLLLRVNTSAGTYVAYTNPATITLQADGGYLRTAGSSLLDPPWRNPVVWFPSGGGSSSVYVDPATLSGDGSSPAALRRLAWRGAHATNGILGTGTASDPLRILPTYLPGGEGFPLAGDVTFASNSASDVGGLQFVGSTNVLASDGTNLLYGGRALGSGSGSGFPLTNDVSAAGFDLTGGGTFQATNGSFRNLYGNGEHVANLAGGTVSADLTLNQDLIVHGNLLVYGAATNYNATIVNVGGSADYSLAASVLLPHLSDGAAMNPVATGHWDYSAASLALPQLLLSNGTATATGSWDFAAATILGLPSQGISAAQAGQIATNVASGYLPLSGYDGLVVLGTRTRGYAASTNLGDYGFAAGSGTSAGNFGFAAGEGTSAGNYGFAAGYDTFAGECGFAAGDSTSAGDYGFAAGGSTSAGYAGFAAGESTSAGEYGFAAGAGTSAGEYGAVFGRKGRGASGSFVFSDNNDTPFNRTNILNSFGLRVAGGIYAEIGTNVFAVSNAVTMNGVELGAGGGSGISAAEAGQIATNVLSTATTNSMPLIDFGSGGGASPAPSKSIGASAVGWPILNTNNAPFVSIVVDTNMGAMLNFPLDSANSVDSIQVVSGTSASITQLVFVARAYAAGGSEWGTVGLKTTFGGSILTNVITLTNAPTTQTVTLAHAPVSGPCVVPFSWGILATSTVGTAVGNARFSVMQARGSW